MVRPPPRATRTDHPLPARTLFRSQAAALRAIDGKAAAVDGGKIGANPETEAPAGRRLVKPGAARSYDGGLLRRQAGAVILDGQEQAVFRVPRPDADFATRPLDRKSTRLNSSH